MKLLLHIVMVLAAGGMASGQNNWTSLEKPTTRNLNRVFFVDTDQGWAVGDSGTILKTTDGGQSWKSQNSGISDEIRCIYMFNQSLGWALALHPPLDTLWWGTIMLKTTNGGATWTRHDFLEESYYAITFVDSVTGLLGGWYGKILKSIDGGSSWLPAIVDSSLFSSFPVLHLNFFSRNYGFALGGRLDIAGVLWKTEDGGQKWSASGAASEPIHGLHYIDSLNLVAVCGDFDGGSNLVRSKNGGRSWENLYLGIWGEARALSFRTQREGWCPLGFAGTYMVTTDTGRTWAQFFSPDTSAIFDVTFIDSTHGFMVGANGTILAYKSTVAGINGNSVFSPESYRLYQNYPNPFNPVTTFTYELAEGTLVTITVYDAAGKEVGTAFKGHREAGVHEVRFDGSGLASGTYFYELTTSNSRYKSTQVRKMILLR